MTTREEALNIITIPKPSHDRVAVAQCSEDGEVSVVHVSTVLLEDDSIGSSILKDLAKQRGRKK